MLALRAGLELRRVADPAHAGRTHPDIADRSFYELAARCGAFTMTSIERMCALYTAVGQVVDQRVRGDVVECGVWRGGSSMLAALTLMQKRDEDRSLWLYDTFEGMPEPGALDKDLSGLSMEQTWSDHKGRRSDPIFAYAGLDDVHANLASTGFPGARTHFVQGKVEDTIPERMPEHIAVLRLDTDWYESTRHELEHLYPRLSAGGVLIIDDYGHWQGARKAVDEWRATIEDPPVLWRIDETARAGVKPAA